MNQLQILHHIEYLYQHPVRLESHVFRLMPRQDGSQRLEAWSLDIDPAPAGQVDMLDAHGNVITQVWFEGEHRALRISAGSTVRTLRSEAFDYPLDAAATSVPVRYRPSQQGALHDCLARGDGGADDPVRRWATNLLAGVAGAGAFVLALTQAAQQQVRTEHRPEGQPQNPADTLRQGRGACRDLAVLCIDACRSVGVAARFVSGYHAMEPPAPAQGELHAWLEAYIPGGGWRGYDPTQGLAVTDRHVAIAAAAHAHDAAPIEGSFRGNQTGAAMSYRVDVRCAASA